MIGLPPPRLWRGLGRLVALLVLLVGAAVASAGSLPAAAGGQPLPSLAPMLAKVTPAVVNISTRTRVAVRSPYFDDPMMRRFFGLPAGPRERVEQSLGSGVIVDAAKGLILTNNHVVGGADAISVTLKDGRTFQATLVGSDPDTDVAVIRIPAERLVALPLSDSSKLEVGDFVVAVGDPFGLGQTVTSGIVSALGRSGLGGSGYQDFIQTDASINPGNSGGALVNLAGELVGINTMIFSPSGGNVGIGFAIPSNLTRSVMTQLVAHGKVERGTLGADTQTLTPRLAQLLGVAANGGVVVTGVRPGSAAEHAGLEPGDVLTTLNDVPLRADEDLRNQIGLLPLASRVRLGVLRAGQPLQIEAVLAAPRLARADGAKLDPRLAGVTFAELAPTRRRQGWYGAAVDSVQAGSRAARAGLAAGDVVIGIGNQRIANLAMLRGLAGVKPRQLVLVVANDEGSRYVVVD